MNVVDDSDPYAFPDNDPSPVKTGSVSVSAGLIRSESVESVVVVNQSSQKISQSEPVSLHLKLQSEPVRSGNLQFKIKSEPVQSGNLQLKIKSEPVKSGNLHLKIQSEPVRSGNLHEPHSYHPPHSYQQAADKRAIINIVNSLSADKSAAALSLSSSKLLSNINIINSNSKLTAAAKLNSNLTSSFSLSSSAGDTTPPMILLPLTPPSAGSGTSTSGLSGTTGPFAKLYPELAGKLVHHFPDSAATACVTDAGKSAGVASSTAAKNKVWNSKLHIENYKRVYLRLFYRLYTIALDFNLYQVASV